MLSIITPTTHDQDASVRFYEALGFNKVASDDHHNFFSDGQTLIIVASDRLIRPGLVLSTYHLDEIPNVGFSPIELPDSQIQLLQSPGGIWLYLWPTEFLPTVSGDISPSICGKFAGFSIEVGDMKKEVDFWQPFGFEPSMGGLTQGWITLRSEMKDTISIMKPLVCPHLFYNPSLTYFNGADNLHRIADIRRSGLPIHEEITHFHPEGKVDNIILRDPGGVGFFIFSD